MNQRQVRLATIALLLANFMGALDETIINTALPTIVAELKGMALIGWVSSVFLLGIAITTVLWGRIADKVGRKISFQISVLMFVLSSTLGGLAPNMSILIVARALMGIASGGMVSIPFIIYADIYPNPAQRAKALGWVTAFYTLGTVCGPLIGGWIVDVLSWRWVFFINLPIGLLAMLTIQFNYFDQRKVAEHQKFDYLGSLMLAIGLIILLLAGDALAVSFVRAGLLLLLGLGLLLIFILVEKHQGSMALIPISLLRDSRIQYQNIIMFLMNGFQIGYSVYAPMWAQSLLGTNATLGGLTQIAASLLLLIATRLTAILMDHLSYKKIVLIGTSSIIISAICMVFATNSAPYWWLIMSGAFEGFGIGLSFTPMQVSIQDGVELDLVSTSTTWGLLVRTLGQTFMASIFGAILNFNNRIQINQNHQLNLSMINRLTDPKTANTLNPSLVQTLRKILFNSLHLIMIIGLVLLVIAFVINLFRKEPIKKAR